MFYICYNTAMLNIVFLFNTFFLAVLTLNKHLLETCIIVFIYVNIKYKSVIYSYSVFYRIGVEKIINTFWSIRIDIQ